MKKNEWGVPKGTPHILGVSGFLGVSGCHSLTEANFQLGVRVFAMTLLNVLFEASLRFSVFSKTLLVFFLGDGHPGNERPSLLVESGEDHTLLVGKLRNRLETVLQVGPENLGASIVDLLNEETVLCERQRILKPLFNEGKLLVRVVFREVHTKLIEFGHDDILFVRMLLHNCKSNPPLPTLLIFLYDFLKYSNYFVTNPNA